jgi:hypothetical protein
LTEDKKFGLKDQWPSEDKVPMVEPPHCDLDKYREHIEDLDLSQEEQADLLKTIWTIMSAFVDLGFGVDSVQMLPSSLQRQHSINDRNLDRRESQDNSEGVTHDK